MIPLIRKRTGDRGNRREAQPEWPHGARRGRAGVVLLLAAWLAGAGCASSGSGDARGGWRSPKSIDRLRMICQPTAINFDQRPGADGFGVTVYPINYKSPKTVAITEGKLDLLLFDGLLKEFDPATAQPLRTWTFTAEQLLAHRFKGTLGVAYKFAPRWEASPPTQPRFTVLARYTSPAGEVRYTEAGVISMLAR